MRRAASGIVGKGCPPHEASPAPRSAYMGREQRINRRVGFRAVDDGVQVRTAPEPVSPGLGEAINSRSDDLALCLSRLSRGQVMRGGAGGGAARDTQAREGESSGGTVGSGRCCTWQSIVGYIQPSGRVPWESFATGVTSVTAARQTGRRMEERKKDRQADRTTLEG